MADIKAIETVYLGYRFRSRLEARWACFFTEAQIKFEYELEGFELPSGGRYLPDFYLPGLKCWVEVKPTIEIALDDSSKLLGFTSSGEHQLLLIVGVPGAETMYLLVRETSECVKTYSECIAESGEPGDAFASAIHDFYRVDFGSCARTRDLDLVDACDRFRVFKPQIDRAKLAARSARFEFGESG